MTLQWKLRRLISTLLASLPPLTASRDKPCCKLVHWSHLAAESSLLFLLWIQSRFTSRWVSRNIWHGGNVFQRTRAACKPTGNYASNSFWQTDPCTHVKGSFILPTDKWTRRPARFGSPASFLIQTIF